MTIDELADQQLFIAYLIRVAARNQQYGIASYLAAMWQEWDRRIKAI